jgi:hypothetical protein
MLFDAVAKVSCDCENSIVFEVGSTSSICEEQIILCEKFHRNTPIAGTEFSDHRQQ